MNTVKPETIDSANRKVSALLASTGSSSAKDEGSRQRLRGSYMKFTSEQKAHFARYALESENKRAIMKYSKQWGVDLKESTVRTWKTTSYTEGLRGRGSRCQSKRCLIENKDDHCCLETNWTQQCRLMWRAYEN